jgi:hypothetical protein
MRGFDGLNENDPAHNERFGSALRGGLPVRELSGFERSGASVGGAMARR